MAKNNNYALCNDGTLGKRFGSILPNELILNEVDGHSQFTIQALLKKNVSTNVVFFFANIGGGTGNTWKFALSITDNGELQFGGRRITSDSVVYTTIAIPNFEIGKYYDCTVIVDSLERKCQMYVNNNFIGEGTIFSTSGVMGGGVGNGGVRLLSTRTGSAYTGYNGEIDEFEFWNKKLTQEEISKYNKKVLTGDEDGLVAYYRFELLDNPMYDICNNYHGNIETLDLVEGEVDLYLFSNYSLIKLKNNIYNLDNDSNWENTNLTEPISKIEFETYGIVDLSVIPQEKWNELDENFEIITWSNDSNSKFVNISTEPFSPLGKLNNSDEFEVLAYSNDYDEIAKESQGIEETIDEGRLFVTTIDDLTEVVNVEII